MKNLKLIVTSTLICCSYLIFGQSEKTKLNDSVRTPKRNISEEIITKTIKVKGANGEEKIITQEQLITKESNIKLNPEDEDKTNQTAIYTPEEVSVKNSGVATDDRKYSMTADGKGFVITFTDELGERVSKAKPLSNDYYLIVNSDNNSALGHFDEKKNLILEMYNSKTDAVIQVIYKAN